MTPEEEVQKLKEENKKLLEQQGKKSDLVSVSAHQIRNSLSAIKWILKMFTNGELGKLTAEQQNLMEKAYEDNDRAIGLVSDLLLANKAEDVMEQKYVFSKVDMVELIEDSIFDLSGEAHAHEVEIIFLKPEDAIPEASVDKEKIRIVLQNLIENAIKYSNQHGKIFVSIIKKKEKLEVSIKDTGIGISDEGQDKIFQKFYRDSLAVKKESIGSGIGLFTSKTIIEKHKGEIWFESIEEEGTTFFFTLPISTDEK